MVGVLALVIALGSCKNRTKNAESNSAATEIVVDQSADIIEKYWKLTAINGEAIPENSMGREAHIIFKIEENRIIGNGSCNSFNGQYELKSGNGIALSKIASTMMACIDMEIEGKFLRSLESYNKYSIVADTLTLTGTGTSARFEVVNSR